MAETIRLNKVLRELNISLDRAVEFLETKGIEIEKRPTTKISDEVYQVLSDEFETDANKKVASKEVSEAKLKEKEALRVEREKEIEAKIQKEEATKKEVVKAKTTLEGPKQVGKIDLDKPKKEGSSKTRRSSKS
jgi:translation initiation factor IF-2